MSNHWSAYSKHVVIEELTANTHSAYLRSLAVPTYCTALQWICSLAYSTAPCRLERARGYAFSDLYYILSSSDYVCLLLY
jgi:hypothetical protein